MVSGNRIDCSFCIFCSHMNELLSLAVFGTNLFKGGRLSHSYVFPTLKINGVLHDKSTH